MSLCILYFSSNSCWTCFGQPCVHHQELTTVRSTTGPRASCATNPSMDELPANRSWQPSCSHGTYQHEAVTSRSRQLLMMDTWLPETCSATIRREIKNTKWHLVGFSYPHSIGIFILPPYTLGDVGTESVTMHMMCTEDIRKWDGWHFNWSLYQLCCTVHHLMVLSAPGHLSRPSRWANNTPPLPPTPGFNSHTRPSYPFIRLPSSLSPVLNLTTPAPVFFHPLVL